MKHQAWAWLYGVNIYTALRGEWSLSYINHFWSLAVEEQFYLFWPLLVYLLLARQPERACCGEFGAVPFRYARAHSWIVHGIKFLDYQPSDPFPPGCVGARCLPRSGGASARGPEPADLGAAAGGDDRYRSDGGHHRLDPSDWGRAWG